ncbi:MAG: serine--tRNA ligase [Cyclobacteriaceae bacterium]|nr:serine--tRNA ligase [Cyclobacteriaceae bacterium]MDH4294722.1 serine--tRNA ligase [Cyclobacteriaceae bacterium]MDH5247561.1 serine--tRNA ligase [Cyclobacteriaceae bacterium]
MLQAVAIREQTERILEGLRKRNFKDAENIIRQVLDNDLLRRDTQKVLDDLKSSLNNNSKEIGNLIKSGNQAEAASLRSSVGADKEKVKTLEGELSRYEKILEELLYKIPNVPHEIVPAGTRPEDNITVFEHGSIPKLGAEAFPHWDLIKRYDIIDFDLGNKISGAGFPVYKGKGAKLQRALINFFLDEADKQNYKEIQPPIVVNEASGLGTGQLPDKEGQMYFIQEDGLYLIPTAEVPITNLYRDVIVAEAALPIKNVGYTPCFRREAGSWGAHVRGLNRLHQFDKVEIVQITKADESSKALDEMCLYVQSLLEKLELPYRKLLLCGGDLGFNAAVTYDMEVFAAGQQRWLEVSSVSNFEAFQANRLKLRCKSDEGKMQLLHTLNGSALALPRIVAAILENNQTSNGIRIPGVLVPYTKFDMID